MIDVFEINLYRPKEFGDCSRFVSTKHILRMDEGIDYLKDCDPREVAEKLFHVTNAPEEFLDDQDIEMRSVYRGKLKASRADDEYKYHSISVGDKINIIKREDGKLTASVAVCEPVGWRMITHTM